MSWFRRRLEWLRAADLRLEAELLVVGVLVLVFMWLGDEVSEGDTHRLDNAILLALRNTPDDPIGSPAVEAAVMHISALGSGVVSALIVIIVGTILLLARRAK